MLRIGYFNIKGFNGFTIDEWQQKGLPIWEPKTVNAAGSAAVANKTCLDVRNLGEWKTGVIDGAKLISLNEIPTRFEEVRGLNNLYINCKSGLRARLASSILAQKGISSTIVADSNL